MDQTNVVQFAAGNRKFPKQVGPAARMQDLMSACGFRTQEELINNALTMFAWAVETVQRGNQVASFNEAAMKYEVVAMPALRTVAERASAGELT